MLPIRDNIPSRTTPYVNYSLIGICCLVFALQSADRTGLLTLQYGMIPARVHHPDAPVRIEVPERVETPRGPAVIVRTLELPSSRLPSWTTLMSCIFLHGSLMHLLGNVWFLYIFGDNVEDRLGHVGYLIFYGGCGVAASLAQYLLDLDSTVPTIGASGAIAGVMGAYLLLYPHSRVMALIPLGIFLQMMVLPAPIFLGIWFVLQLVQGTFSLGAARASGVAWWAHVGGFAAGFVVAWSLNRTGTTRPRVTVVRPGTESSRSFRIRRP